MKQELSIWVEKIKAADEKVRGDGARRLCKLAMSAIAENKAQLALDLTALGKSLRTPCHSLDLLRAVAFLMLEQPLAAYEALKEELRYFPENKEAVGLLQELTPQIAKDSVLFNNSELQSLYTEIRDFTMVGPQRISSLYEHAREICEMGVTGHFVECGVAGGGTSALLASVIKRYAKRDTQLFCCDSFSGMPSPSVEDTHRGEPADDTGWGTGTCAAPETSVLSLCKRLGTEHLIQIVKGYFEETLPVWKERIGQISFLHMDGDWYSSTKAILENLYDSLIPGAFVQVDDYGHWDGCKKAIHEFTKEKNVTFVLHSIDGSGVWFRKQ